MKGYEKFKMLNKNEWQTKYHCTFEHVKCQLIYSVTLKDKPLSENQVTK